MIWYGLLSHSTSLPGCQELGRVVLNVCAVVPDGVVLFLPSYSYEDELYKFWETQGYIEKLEKRKKVLREPRSTADTDKVSLSRSGGVKVLIWRLRVGLRVGSGQGLR